MGGHLQPRVRVAKRRREVGGDPGCGAEQKQPEASARAHRGKRLHEVDAGDRLADLAALAASRPHDPAAVGQAERCTVQHASELPVFARPHDELGIDRRHQMRPSAFDELFDSQEGRRHVDAVHPDAEDAGVAGTFGQVCCCSENGVDSRLNRVVLTVFILGPRPMMKSGSCSPPVTRTRLHVYRFCKVCICG